MVHDRVGRIPLVVELPIVVGNRAYSWGSQKKGYRGCLGFPEFLNSNVSCVDELSGFVFARSLEDEPHS